MRPRERSETGEQDLFRSRLDQIIDMKHPLVTLGRTVDWGFLEKRFGEVYTDDPGRPPLPTRLMARTVSSNSPGCGRSNSSTREAGHGWFFSLTLFPWQEFRRPA